MITVKRSMAEAGRHGMELVAKVGGRESQSGPGMGFGNLKAYAW